MAQRMPEQLDPQYRQLLESVFPDDPISPDIQLLQARLEQNFQKQVNFTINPETLFYPFISPSITRQFLVSSLLTLQATGEAQEAGDPNLLREHMFFVGFVAGGGMGASQILSVPLEFSLRRMENIAFVSDGQAPLPILKYMWTVHTHPPSDNILVPSVIEKHGSVLVGDLFLLHGLNPKVDRSRWSGTSGEYVVRPIMVITQMNLTRDITSMLFIRESPNLALVGEEKYEDMLYAHSDRLTNVEDKYRLTDLLISMGFMTAYADIPYEQYFHFPMVDEQQLDEIFPAMLV